MVLLLTIVRARYSRNMTSESIHDAESVPKLYGNPGMLGFFTHAQAVSTRLSFFESLGTRLVG